VAAGRVLVALTLLALWGTAEARESITGVVITNPVGAYMRYDVDVPVGGGFEVGLFDEFLFYSNTAGLKLGWATTPEWLRLTVDLGVDPGWFMKLAPDESYREEGERTFGVRYLVRPQLLINIRSDQWWLYGRTTGVYRHRDFREADTFQGISLGKEASIEQAYALMRRIGGTAPAAIWVYLEHTVGALRDFGTRPNRISAGVFTEEWPWSQVVLNLDLYYSFAASPLAGPGALFTWVAVW